MLNNCSKKTWKNYEAIAISSFKVIIIESLIQQHFYEIKIRYILDISKQFQNYREGMNLRYGNPISSASSRRLLIRKFSIEAATRGHALIVAIRSASRDPFFKVDRMMERYR